MESKLENSQSSRPSSEVITKLKAKIRNVPDFPIPGILFRDITPLLQDPESFKLAIDAMSSYYNGKQIDLIAAIESRGYILASAMAYRLGVGFVPIRKPGKLPAEKISQSYVLEYGSNVLEMHKDGVKQGQKILIVDDLIATGGSASATKKMIESLGAKVISFAFLIELKALNGRKLLEGTDVFSLLDF